mmetsp:Transcript_36004/g.80978  ORF Transcript_36004/g.80978 Transcript_36004/m.80978 type:complete len:213 (+) Transcript_36004:698-1336(+)
MSEPGRYFAEASSSILTRVVGKRTRTSPVSHEPAPVSECVPPSGPLVGDAAPLGGPFTGLFTVEGEVHYYVSDGIYGAFNAIIYDGWLPEASPFRLVPGAGAGGAAWLAEPVTLRSVVAKASIFGPTCDSLDMVFHGLDECPDLEVGDWLLFPNAGAYTSAGACDFNGIPATAQGGVRSFYVRSMDLAASPEDKALSLIRSDKPPMQVQKNF